MNLSTVRMISLTAFAALATTMPMHASEQATFHLPVKAHWGTAILEPGDYKVSLPTPSVGEVNFRVAGAGQTVLELPQVTDLHTDMKSSHLTLSEVDGKYFVREFASRTAGKKFLFAVPGNKHSRQLARVKDSNIPVYAN